VDIVDLIKRDHDEISDLFERLAVLAVDGRRPDEVARIVSRLVIAVRVHSRAEERVVYELLRTQVPVLKSFALAGPHQHEMLDITIDKLLWHAPGEEMAVLVRVAHDLFEMHARDEEEGEVLPKMREVMRPEELAALVRDLANEKARILPMIERLAGVPARAA
jgi:hypothetical protein